VERFASSRGEFHALRLAARERGGLLADLDVAEADVASAWCSFSRIAGGLEELARFLDGHVEHVGDGLALVGDLQRLAVVALALAVSQVT
jgi:hypothetical protein